MEHEVYVIGVDINNDIYLGIVLTSTSNTFKTLKFLAYKSFKEVLDSWCNFKYDSIISSNTGVLNEVAYQLQFKPVTYRLYTSVQGSLIEHVPYMRKRKDGTIDVLEIGPLRVVPIMKSWLMNNFMGATLILTEVKG